MAKVIDFKTKEVIEQDHTIQSVKMHRLYTFHPSVTKYFGKFFVIAITPNEGRLKLFNMYAEAEKQKKVSEQC